MAASFASIYITVYLNGRRQTRWITGRSATLPHIVEALRKHIPPHVPYEIISFTKWTDYRKTFPFDGTWADFVASGKAKLAAKHPFDLERNVPLSQIDVASRIRVGRNLPQSDVDMIINKHIGSLQKDLDELESAYTKIRSLTLGV